eukprot:11224220-Prorocentrum_lima.AAC.1
MPPYVGALLLPVTGMMLLSVSAAGVCRRAASNAPPCNPSRKRKFVVSFVRACAMNDALLD